MFFQHKRRRTIQSRAVRQARDIYIRTPKVKTPAKWPKIVLRSILRFLIIAVVVSFLYFVFLSGYFQIKNVIIIGNKIVSQQEIENIVNPWFSKNLLASNILFFKANEARADLINQIIVIKNAYLRRKFPNTLEINIIEREPVIIWESGGERFWVDLEGVPFLKVSSGDSRPDLILVVDEKNAPVKIGQKIAGSKFPNFVKELSGKLPLKTDYTIDHIVVKEVTFDVEVIVNKGLSLYFDTTRSVDSQLSALLKVLEDAQAKNIPIREYIDLRLENKVFYK